MYSYEDISYKIINFRCLCAEFAAAKVYSINHLQQPENWLLVQKAQIVYVTVCIEVVTNFIIVALWSNLATVLHTSWRGTLRTKQEYQACP